MGNEQGKKARRKIMYHSDVGKKSQQERDERKKHSVRLTRSKIWLGMCSGKIIIGLLP